MERGSRDFSIEPYVEGGGIMGDKLEVNQEAAGSIMKRTALRRDVVVVKGMERDRLVYEGVHELAVKKHRWRKRLSLPSRAKRAQLSSVKKTPDSFLISVNDQKVWEDVDGWMEKHFKAEPGDSGKGRREFNARFAKLFNEATVDSLHTAFWEEKQERFSFPLRKVDTFALNIAIACTILLHGMIVYENNPIIGYQSLGSDVGFETINSVLTMFQFVAFAVLYKNDLNCSEREYAKVGRFEAILVNPQIPSIILGNASLALNSGKLIKLKEGN